MSAARRFGLAVLAVALGAVWGGSASAEPAFAIRTGLACSTCHVNNTGGGMRTAYGSIYTQTVLPMHQVRWRNGGNLLPANPDARFNVGADVRIQYLNVESDDGAETVSSFEVTEANVYLLGRLIPRRMDLYLDEIVGPGGASARELFGMFRFWKESRAWVKVGKFLPNYGFRLPDDESFIRSQTGFTYSAPDTGVEFGIEPGRWTVTAAAINGASGGGSDSNDEKKIVAQAVHRFKTWRVGASGSLNVDNTTSDSGDTRNATAGIHAGVNWGRLALLGEIDMIEAKTIAGTRDRAAAYIEANLLLDRGINLKYVHDWYDPDRDQSTDEQTRDSFGIEFIPIPFLQVRTFVRLKDGPPQVLGTRDTQYDFELHFFF